MGTRGMIGIQTNKQILGTYNHFDSYPDCLGQEIVDFLNKADKNKLKDKMLALIWVGEDVPPTSTQIEKYIQFSNTSVSSGSLDNWYCLLRNAQGIEGLRAIYDGHLDVLIDGSEFLKDSLYCEWGYIMNFDTECLDIYEGYQKIPGTDFSSMGRQYSYGPCKLILSIPFNDLSIVSDLVEYMKQLEVYKDE